MAARFLRESPRPAVGILAAFLGGVSFILGEHLFELAGPVLRLFGHAVGVVRDRVLAEQAFGVVVAEGVDGMPALEGVESQLVQDPVSKFEARMKGVGARCA